MKEKNIVYGYDKQSPYITSNNFYTGRTNNHDLNKRFTDEDKNKLRQSSVQFGNKTKLDYFTSNKMQQYKPNVNSSGHKRSNKSHISLAQDKTNMSNIKTTYKESISNIQSPIRSDLINKKPLENSYSPSKLKIKINYCKKCDCFDMKTL